MGNEKNSGEFLYNSSCIRNADTDELLEMCYKKAKVFRKYEENGFTFFCHKVEEEREPFRITEASSGFAFCKGNNMSEVEENFATRIKEKSRKDILLKLVEMKKKFHGIPIVHV